MKGPLKRSCPHCRSQEFSRSHRRGFIEKYVLSTFRMRAYRCIKCDTRFYAPAHLQEASNSRNQAA